MRLDEFIKAMKRWNVSESRVLQEWNWIQAEKNSEDIFKKRIETATPLAYILGHWEFFGQHVFVSADTLIPRPETEYLVQLILDSESEPDWVFDIGTGSGCILKAISTQWTQAKLVGVDISKPALKIAQSNVSANWIQSSLIDGFTIPQNSVVIANLPYVPNSRTLDKQVADFEPAQAIYAGPKGTELIDQLGEKLIEQNFQGSCYIELDSETHLSRKNWVLIPDLDGKLRFAKWKC